MVWLSVELLQALRDCMDTLLQLDRLLEEDRTNMPECISGEILREYLRGVDRAREITASLLADLRGIAAGE